MPLDLPDGTACFVDSNVLYYSLIPVSDLSEMCAKFVDRIISGKLSAYCSVGVLGDAIHKVMMYEIVEKTGRPRSGLIACLKRHPEVIATLKECTDAAQRLVALPLRLLEVNAGLITKAAHVSVDCQLLTSDAAIVALMHEHGIVHLVTNDDDFDRVPGITVWKPRP